MSDFQELLVKKAIELRKPESSSYTNYYERFGGYPLPIIGCTKSEIEEIMKAQNVTYLPKIFVEYLLAMGRQSGDIYIGEDVGYRILLGIKSTLKALMADVNIDLPENSFVFQGSQGIAFYLFYTDSNDEDPPIYIWSIDHYEGELDGYPNEESPKLLGISLSKYLTTFIKERESEEAQEKILSHFN